MRRLRSSATTCSRVWTARLQIAEAHLLVAERDAQQRLARLQREAFLDLLAGQFELVLILVDARAVVVDDGGVRRVEAQRGVELVERLLVEAVDAQGHAGDEVDVPVVGGGLEEVLDAVAGGLFFAAREQHVDAVEIGLDRAGVELEGACRRRGGPRAHASVRPGRGARTAGARCPGRTRRARSPHPAERRFRTSRRRG